MGMLTSTSFSAAGLLVEVERDLGAERLTSLFDIDIIEFFTRQDMFLGGVFIISTKTADREGLEVEKCCVVGTCPGH